MKQEIAKQWSAALRSGDYKQGRGRLQHANTFCCLGVLCELAVQEGVITKDIRPYSVIYDGEEFGPSGAVLEWSGIKTTSAYLGGNMDNDCLIGYNDVEGYTFGQIADVIDEHWESL